MKQDPHPLLRTVVFGLTVPFWLWLPGQRFSTAAEVLIIVVGLLFVFPVVRLGRFLLDRDPTSIRAAWITMFVHFFLMMVFGAAIIRAVVTYPSWVGWLLPIPAAAGLLLAIFTGAGMMLTVLNLAWKGLGAPFAIALTRRLAVDWMYAWTRNPMGLGLFAFLLAMGLWFRSALFVLWVLMLVVPSWLYFVRVYEERELEIRFGASYLEYRSKTPMLFPRRPGARKKRRTGGKRIQ